MIYFNQTTHTPFEGLRQVISPLEVLSGDCFVGLSCSTYQRLSRGPRPDFHAELLGSRDNRNPECGGMFNPVLWDGCTPVALERRCIRADYERELAPRDFTLWKFGHYADITEETSLNNLRATGVEEITIPEEAEGQIRVEVRFINELGSLTKIKQEVSIDEDGWIIVPFTNPARPRNAELRNINIYQNYRELANAANAFNQLVAAQQGATPRRLNWDEIRMEPNFYNGEKKKPFVPKNEFHSTPVPLP